MSARQLGSVVMVVLMSLASFGQAQETGTFHRQVMSRTDALGQQIWRDGITCNHAGECSGDWQAETNSAYTLTTSDGSVIRLRATMHADRCVNGPVSYTIKKVHMVIGSSGKAVLNCNGKDVDFFVAK
jgi:hypothetical protein